MWKSPITTESLTKDSNRFAATFADPQTSKYYLLEGRPAEKGRVALLEFSQDGEVKELFPTANLTSQVHEYGGGPFAARDGLKVFVDKTTNSIYQQSGDDIEPTVVIDQANLKRRTNFADFNVSPCKRYAVCVKEEHFSPSAAEVVNSIALIDLMGNEVIDLVKGNDFYSCPRFSPDGKKLVWITWNHPEMPWTSSTLYGAKFSYKCISTPIQITTKKKEAISRPVWGDDDTVYFASDYDGYSNLYSYKFADDAGLVEQITTLDSDFTTPDWVFGESTFDVLPYGKLVAQYCLKGEAVLCIVDPVLKTIENLSEEFSVISDLRYVYGDTVCFIARGATLPSTLFTYDLKSRQKKIIRKSANLDIDDAFISKHEHLEYPVAKGKTAHIVFYPPTNPNYKLESPPPCIILCHGGPTAKSQGGLSLQIQYWTTRGFAYACLNYGGSTGYGREFRERLNGKWGVVDVDDACRAAEWLFLINGRLTAKGLADGQKMAIHGGSAGGYTAIAVMAFRPGVFKAGRSAYGICSLESLAKLTHKFEAHYLISLLGGSIEKIPQVYHDRSPIYFADNISAPLLIQQGSVDKVVPPNQAEMIVESIKSQGGRVDYQLFEGEGHGFRQAQNIKAAVEKELEFYQDVFHLKEI